MCFSFIMNFFLLMDKLEHTHTYFTYMTMMMMMFKLIHLYFLFIFRAFMSISLMLYRPSLQKLPKFSHAICSNTGIRVSVFIDIKHFHIISLLYSLLLTLLFQSSRSFRYNKVHVVALLVITE